jgi:putative addiction module killer protein
LESKSLWTRIRADKRQKYRRCADKAGLILGNHSITVLCMFIVRRTDVFAAWLEGLKDRRTRARLVRRLEKVERGVLGDVEDVGKGVSEMREHFGPGWRMYYIQRGLVLVVMLGGGDKSTQKADIKAAIALAETLEM